MLGVTAVDGLCVGGFVILSLLRAAFPSPACIVSDMILVISLSDSWADDLDMAWSWWSKCIPVLLVVYVLRGYWANYFVVVPGDWRFVSGIPLLNICLESGFYACCWRRCYRLAIGKVLRSIYWWRCGEFWFSVLLSSYIDSGMVPTRIFVLDNLYLKLCFLTCSTVKKFFAICD